MSDSPDSTRSLLTEAAYARTRVDLDLVPPKAVQELRAHLGTGGSFDGSAVVRLCLEGRAADGEAVLKKTLMKLRSELLLDRVVATPTSPSPRRSRRKTSILTRLTATVLGRTIAFGASFLLTVLILVIVQQLVPAIDIYAWTDAVLGKVRAVSGR